MNKVKDPAPGHVFVTVADITHLHVDAWLLPTDQELTFTQLWGVTKDQKQELRNSSELKEFRAGKPFAAPWPGHKDGPLPVLTAVPLHGATKFADLEPRLRAGLEEAAEAAHKVRTDGRIPLIATPAFGIGGGGADPKRGEVIDGILTVAGEVARDKNVDVVVCLWRRVDYALAQHIRRDQWDKGSAAPLDTASWAKAKELAAHARNGDLVPFMGSGVSATAGLPSWSELLDKLKIKQSDEDDTWMEKLGPLDMATVLESQYQDPTAFTQEVAKLVEGKRFGLAPTLLANLPGTSAVTLNYDQLYETAWQDAWHDAPKELKVLPWDSLKPSEPWLLKLHGDVDHPESIVLTRSHYLDFAVKQRGLASLATALLMTKHLLFVGFGLADDHFHEIVHEVRGIRPTPLDSESDPSRGGTALVLGDGRIHKAVWDRDFAIVPFTKEGGETDFAAAGRSLEIFLDVMVGLSGSDEPFILDQRFKAVVDPGDLKAATELVTLYQQLVTAGLGGASPTQKLRDLLVQMGQPDPS